MALKLEELAATEAHLTDRINMITTSFAELKSWEDRYRLLVEWGRRAQGLHNDYQIDKYRIRGCQSQVWFRAYLKEGAAYFEADSDSHLIKGIITLICQVYSGFTPEQILEMPPDFLKEIGLSEHLSMNRSNGLAAMVSALQRFAYALNLLVQKGVRDVEI